MQWRQGDVLIERFDWEKEEPGPQTEERLLVRGEGRYHGHFLVGDGKVFENEGFSPEQNVSHFLELTQEATLKHLHTETREFTGEHAEIKLKPGRYRVIRQREYNPYARVISILQD